MHDGPDVPGNKDSGDTLENTKSCTLAVASVGVEVGGNEGAKTWADAVKDENDSSHVRINFGVGISAAFFCFCCYPIFRGCLE